MHFLGIDIGTTNTKALILSEKFEVAAEGSFSYPIQFLGDGGVEQDPEDWWQACCQILRRFWMNGISPEDIRSVAVSGHGASLVAADEKGAILRPAISSLDTRCKDQTAEIRSKAEHLIRQYNGNQTGSFNFEPKLLWLKQTEPLIYEKMPCFLTATGYINFKLTGNKCANLSDGGISMAYDRMESDQWNRDIIAAAGLDIEKYPPLVSCTDIIGSVTAQASIETGLPGGVPVLAGGEDTSSAAFSIGVTCPGDAFLSLGTQGTVGVCTDQFSSRPEILRFPHVLPRLDLLSGSMSTFGGGMEWFLREWCKDLKEQSDQDPSVSIHERLAKECEMTSPGSKGLIFLPYLSGEMHPVLDEHATGTFFGLKHEHTRADMARALMEGCGYAVKDNLLYAKQVSGDIKELKAVGGPTRNALWCHIIADVTQLPVKIMGVKGIEEGGAPLGNILLSMISLETADVYELLTSRLIVKKEYKPALHLKELYDYRYMIYKKLYKQTKDIFPLLPVN